MQLPDRNNAVALSFGVLKHLDLRSAWPHEGTDFTPWLAENLQHLGNALGMELEISQREASVGSFALDLLAKDLGTGHNVVIENQFGVTNHDHLGKLLTYAAGFEASTVIWVSETIREEHRFALDWLNQRTGTDTQFFGVVVEVFQIDDSRPVFNFKPVVFPNEWQKSKGPVPTGKTSPKAEAYRSFIQQLIDILREEHRFTGARVAQAQSWYSFSSGVSGINYAFSFAMGERARVELYIDLGDSVRNKNLFDAFAAERLTIESAFGEQLEWERLDDKRASRVAIYRSGRIEADEDRLAEIRSWAVVRLLRMRSVFAPRLKGLTRSNRSSLGLTS